MNSLLFLQHQISEKEEESVLQMVGFLWNSFGGSWVLSVYQYALILGYSHLGKELP